VRELNRRSPIRRNIDRISGPLQTSAQKIGDPLLVFDYEYPHVCIQVISDKVALVRGNPAGASRIASPCR
jgi:hypothetical protein